MIRSVRSEAGMTLVEAMFTIVLVGIAFAALLGGLWTAVVASDFNVKQTTAEATARAFAEFLKRDAGSTSYSPCADRDAYDYSSFSSPGFVPSIVSVGIWRKSTSTFGSCPPSPEADGGLQLIKVRVASQDGRAEKILDFVKRRTALS